MEQYFNIEDVIRCRICNSLECGMNILTEQLRDENVLLHEALEFITCLKVEPGDGMSETLCQSCIGRLLDAYRFKNQALDAYNDHSSCNIKNIVAIVTDDGNTTDNDTISKESGVIRTEIDMTTDAATFIIEHQLNNLSKESPSDKVDFNTDWLITTKKIINRTTNTDSRLECQICEKTFRKKSNLVDHLRLHADIKKFTCDYCDKSFVQVGNYRTHLRIHTKERPYECTLCGKTYNQSGTLNVHLRSHTQERRFICTVCSKRFNSSSDLCKHKRVHDISQHFQCKFCEKSFAQKVNLKTHEQKYHSILLV